MFINFILIILIKIIDYEIFEFLISRKEYLVSKILILRKFRIFRYFVKAMIQLRILVQKPIVLDLFSINVNKKKTYNLK